MAEAAPESIIVIDHSVYPDVEHGEEFEDDYDRADFARPLSLACRADRAELLSRTVGNVGRA